MSDLLFAINFAAEKHKFQRRKDPEETPYINHPIGVALLISNAGIDDLDVLRAAILHDTVEDTDTTIEEIGENFGKRVEGIVAEVTDDRSLPKAERKRLQIENAKHKSVEAKLVKLADKLYNLKDLNRQLPIGWTEERRTEYFIWAEQVVNGCRGTNAKLEQQLDEVFASRK